jgi:hypothetical protein
MKTRKKEESLNMRLAFYFLLTVILIISISIIFKSIDVVRSSKFDGKNRFTVGLLGEEKSSLISVSPQEGTISYLSLKGASTKEQIEDNLSVPVNAYVKGASDAGPKNTFLKLLFNRNDDSDLSIVDLFRLSLFSLGVDNEKIVNQETSLKENNSDYESKLFIDKRLQDEELDIEVVNATETPGLGNKFAEYISNSGGTVVLVRTSKEKSKESLVKYTNDSYTVDKLSKLFNFRKEKLEDVDSISDILIVIGEDSLN